jgi:uncharacterized protein YyaL (SSP411 family)
MSDSGLNGLAGARSAYLRSAMGQPVQWMEWGPEAFARAVAEDKPVLLDIGAVWCHWCHVMDRESYEDVETARLINEHFVAVKVDRDERPEVDARYQAAVAAISGQGGWPLTAFLTPAGLPYFGGGYFPPVDGHGRPGLRRVLMTMAEAYERRRDEVLESAGSVMAAIEHNESFDGCGKNPGAELVGKMIDSALKQFDPRYGGFGTEPKFPYPAMVDLLLDEAGRSGSDPTHRDDAAMNGAQDRSRSGSARAAAMMTLEKMSRGGVYDQLAGGFHRYSVDERWVVPHFEKMSYDNSELLKNYVHAYQSTGEAACGRIATEIVGWVDACLSDRALGGFYGSQDADESLEDDGDYFTWTREEAAAVLTVEELSVAGEFFDIGEIGDMHHNPLKNVLHVEQPLGAVAAKAGVTAERAAVLVRSAKAKLYAARMRRKTPFVDETVYAGWNGMMCSAYLEAGRVLGSRGTVEFGLKTLDRVLAGVEEKKNAQDAKVALRIAKVGHVVSYGGGLAGGPWIAGVLEDYLFVGWAALDAWETTGEYRYFESALGLAEAAVARFYDEEKGGFFDTEIGGEGKIGALTAKRKPVQDSPTPAGNSVGAALLLRLEALTGRAEFGAKARATLECFAGVAEHLGLYAASYGLALRRMVEAPVQVVVVGADAAADVLEREALRGYAVTKSVVRLRGLAGPLPPALAEAIPQLPEQEGSFAVVCKGFSCGLPVRTAADLRGLLRL